MSDGKDKKNQGKTPQGPKERRNDLRPGPKPSGWIGESSKKQEELNKAYELKPKTPPKPKK